MEKGLPDPNDVECWFMPKAEIDLRKLAWSRDDFDLHAK
jgi:hypothetical protein